MNRVIKPLKLYGLGLFSCKILFYSSNCYKFLSKLNILRKPVEHVENDVVCDINIFAAIPKIFKFSEDCVILLLPEVIILVT